MPCDGKWRSEDIDLFEHWIAGGMAWHSYSYGITPAGRPPGGLFHR